MRYIWNKLIGYYKEWGGRNMYKFEFHTYEDTKGLRKFYNEKTQWILYWFTDTNKWSVSNDGDETKYSGDDFNKTVLLVQR